MRIRHHLAGLLILALSFSCNLAPVQAEEHGSLESLFLQLPESPAKEALFRIPDLGRRLLALRSYSRAGKGLRRRWSWSDEQIKAYEGTAENEALLAEVGEIAAHFAEANPGYELYIRTRVRSLDTQITNWNKSKSVLIPAIEILVAWKEKFGEESEAEGKFTEKAFWKWLNTYRRKRRPGLAAPGLSRHGQGRAIDFQIKKDGEIYAGTNFGQVKSVWKEEGWDEKLKTSITSAGPSFTGPLKLPYEPWHYDYNPAAPTAVAKEKAGETRKKAGG